MSPGEVHCIDGARGKETFAGGYVLHLMTPSAFAALFDTVAY